MTFCLEMGECVETYVEMAELAEICQKLNDYTECSIMEIKV